MTRGSVCHTERPPLCTSTTDDILYNMTRGVCVTYNRPSYPAIMLYRHTDCAVVFYE